MTTDSVIIWTPEQRRKVMQFLRLYADQLERQMDDAEAQFGLPQAQNGALHLVDMLIPSGAAYVASRGPKQSILEGVTVLLTSEEAQAYEDVRQGNNHPDE